MTLKISRAMNRGAQGHVLAMVLVVVTICAIALMSYLTLVNSQNRVVARSQGWNSTVPVMEAGVEEALAHLNANAETGLNVDGWVRIGNYYRMERAAGDSYYVVTITVTNTLLPIIESRGFCRMPILVQHNNNSPFFLAVGGPSYNRPREGYIGRGVRIAARKNGSLTKAMLSKGRIDIGGNVRVDSYNSCDSSLSTGGLYDPTKADDSGDIASNGQFVKQVSTGGDVQIKGHISTGPGGTMGMSGSAISIGSEEWIDSGRTGVEPGWFRDDMNANIPDSPIPPPGGLPPAGGWVGTTYYDMILSSGVYQVPELQMSSSQKILVTGDAVLKVNGDLQMTGSSAIEIASTGSLQLFVSGRNASLGGSGIINQSKDPWRFNFYGAKTTTRVDFSGGSAFYGTIYAPYAELNLAGGSLIYGGTVSKTIKATGGFTLHYDQCLSKGGQGRYIVTSWDEMTPQEVAQVP
jgi:putative adhesin